MVFSELSFIFFILPLFIFTDFLVKKNVGLRNITLICISLIFYAWGSGHYFHILIIYGILNYLFGILLNKSINFKHLQKEKSKLPLYLLCVFISINIFGLFFFKYLHWMASILQNIFLSLNFDIILNIKNRELPLGISFFTFHAISYLVDIYNKTIEYSKSPIKFLTYFFMFPHLIAGPIVRYSTIYKELSNRNYTKELFTYGLSRFILGVNKKILIANSVAPIADLAFSCEPELVSSSYLWLGAIAYTLQIYFDFSAYSDMAIGLAAMAGFKFCENFNSPYHATSVKDFWRRWHISLSQWLRDYLYIPLGGSRCSTQRTYFNLILVFFLCGLWHGANTTFVFWGLYNGFFLIIERCGLSQLLEKLPYILQRAYLILVILIGWVIFRADNFDYAQNYLFSMFTFNNQGSSFEIGLLNFIVLIISSLIVIFNFKKFKPSPSQIGTVSIKTYGMNGILFIISVMIMYFGARNPFIYFNF